MPASWHAFRNSSTLILADGWSSSKDLEFIFAPLSNTCLFYGFLCSEVLFLINISIPETRQKISDATKGIPRGPRSAESIKKGAASSKGKHCSAETRQKISDANRGKSSPLKGKPTGPNGRKGKPTGPHSAESKQKMSDAKKGKPTGPRPKVECPHCGKIGGGGAMEQWHFDNCKMKPID